MDERKKRRHLALMLVDVEKTESCWNWTGRLNQYGYGLTGIKGGSTLAHRSLWELLRESIPDGMCLLHSCDNRKCVNPAHLHVGTQAENMAEASARKRFPSRKGELNIRAKLTLDQVNEIRADRSMSNVSLGKKYGVSDVQIGNIKRGMSWETDGEVLTTYKDRAELDAVVEKVLGFA